MKCKVVKRFYDLEEKVKRNVNDEFTPSSQKRGKQIIAKGFAEEIQEKKRATKQKDTDAE